MPTKKTSSLGKLKVYIEFMTQRMDLLLGFSQLKPFRRLRLRSFLFMKKKLRQICELLAPRGKRVAVGFGDWSNQDVGGIIKKSPAGPVKVFERELTRFCTVIPIAEYRTNKVHFNCERELTSQYSQRLCRDGEIHTKKVYCVLHCLHSGCHGRPEAYTRKAKGVISKSAAECPRPTLQSLPHILQLVSDFLPPATIDAAVYHDLQRVIQVYEPFRPYTVGAMDGAASLGRLDIVCKLALERHEGCSSIAFIEAAANNHLEVLLWLNSHFPTVRCKVAEVTAAAEHTDIVAYILYTMDAREQRRSDVTSALIRAAANGHTAVVLILRRLVTNAKEAAVVAATNGHVPVLRVLYERYSRIFWTYVDEALEQAIRSRHLDAINFLIEVGQSYYNPDRYACMVLKAATSNSVSVVDPLLDDMDSTSINPFPHVLQFVNELLLPTTIDGAIYNDLKHMIQDYTGILPCTVGAMDGAAARGRLSILEKLQNTRSEGCSSNAFIGAAAHAHLDVIWWLNEFYARLARPGEMAKAAARNGHVQVVELLWTQLSDEELECVLKAASSGGHNDVVDIYL
ncbi:Hypothetical protein PHPALM_17205 [Phytophthora palmivora]|uniref:Uncharacterized protein n=1 Tax=Phytophthora palmivora TaxID=4796 RepID=A0A2P4XMT5_9STRA|nr:Hypothetical protein PHPALM_17205 [Phytophthora palmivora]